VISRLFLPEPISKVLLAEPISIHGKIVVQSEKIVIKKDNFFLRIN